MSAINLREQMRHVTITVERQYGIFFESKWRVFIGLTLIQWGCRLCGINFEDESK
jgi:hypothetical protein